MKVMLLLWFLELPAQTARGPVHVMAGHRCHVGTGWSVARTVWVSSGSGSVWDGEQDSQGVVRSGIKS